MRKIFVLVMGIAFSLGFGTHGLALDNSSLQSQTTEQMYDRSDPFDLANTPGLLYKVDRWRLYTNLSGYGDEDSYLIGTSGNVGPGSLAFFYETNKYKLFSDSLSTSYSRVDYPWGGPSGPYPNYDEDDDYLSDSSTNYIDDYKEEANNFVAAYSMDFDRFSVGLSYAPEFIKREESIYLIIYEGGMPLDMDWNEASSEFYNTWFYGFSSYYYRSTFSRVLEYIDETHQIYDLDTDTWDVSGNLKTDETDYALNLQSHVHMAEQWTLLVGLHYSDIEEQDDARASAIFSGREENTETGYLWTENGSVTSNGSSDEAFDGQEWGIYLEPIYRVNDRVSLRLNLGYLQEDGDTQGGAVTTLNTVATERATTGALTEQWNITETYDTSATGDLEGSAGTIEPRVYLTYDSVRFAVGIGYYYADSEGQSIERDNKTAQYVYSDGDGVNVNDADDWTLAGSWTQTNTIDYDQDTSTWRLPVAVEFDATEKLSLRAGAAYYRQEVETSTRTTYGSRENENYTITDGQGNKLEVGPEERFASAPSAGDVGQAYQASRSGATSTYETKLTQDWTTYNVGLAYQLTKNLKGDLMWTGGGEGGSVDMTEVYVSVTLAF